MPRGFYPRVKPVTEETRRKLSASLKGKKKPEGFGEKIRQSHLGNKNHAWKGENVSYKVLHKWVRRHKGIPKSCIKCGSGKGLEWANISGQYKRDLNDFRALCKFCHRKEDTKGDSIKKKYGKIY